MLEADLNFGYKFRRKADMIRRAECIGYSLPYSLEGIAAGLAVKMPVYHMLHLMLFKKVRKGAGIAFFVEGGIMEHGYYALTLACPIQRHAEANSFSVIYLPV